MACVARIRAVKEHVTGFQLAEEHSLPLEFGQILDQVRALKFDETPDYSGYRKAFQEVWNRHELSGHDLDWSTDPGTLF